MKKPCSTCGGTGQIGYFQGVSRFLLTWEECPNCCGTGWDETETDATRQDKTGEKKGNKGAGGKKQGK